eukprot:4540933-Pyramimonas_sp.AAC.1
MLRCTCLIASLPPGHRSLARDRTRGWCNGAATVHGWRDGQERSAVGTTIPTVTDLDPRRTVIASREGATASHTIHG